MRHHRLGPTLTTTLGGLLFAVALSLFAATGKAAEPQAAAEETGAKQMTALPADKIPIPIRRAVQAPDRPQRDKERDAGRKPEQVLAFFGVRPGMRVLDLWAGAGYSTELLARIVGPKGRVYSQNRKFPPKLARFEQAWRDRMARLTNVVPIEKPLSAPDVFASIPTGSLDMVLTQLNYHDMVRDSVDRQRLNRELFRLLKPAGVYGVSDNSAEPGSGVRDATTLHRIDEAVVVREVKGAGFKLVAASDALRNPSDDRHQGVFTMRGQQDRFLLKFVKPAD